MAPRIYAHFALLAIAGALVAWRTAEVTRSERQIARLETLVQTAKENTGREKKSVLPGEYFEDAVKEAAPLLRRIARGIREKRPMENDHTRLRILIAGFSREQVEEALDEYEALEDPKPDSLLTELAQRLVKLSPMAALEYFRGLFQEREGAIFTTLVGAMIDWVKTDPAAAAAWLDREIAAGHFESTRLDGHSIARTLVERPLINHLLVSDPEAARRRIEAIPPEHRSSTFMGIFPTSDNAAAYAELARATLASENAVNNAFKSATYNIVEAGGGYREIGRFLDESGATPEMRVKIVTEAVERMEQRNRFSAGPLKPEELDAIRSWVSKVAPGAEEEVMPKLLGANSQPRNPNAPSDKRRHPLPD